MLTQNEILYFLFLGKMQFDFEPNGLINFKLIGAEVFLFIVLFFIFCLALLKSTNKYYLMQLNTIYLSILTLLYCLFILNNTEVFFSYSVHFEESEFFIFVKKIASFIGIILFLLSINYNKRSKIVTFEFSSILLLSIWSIFLLVSSTDLIGIYLILELQSFCFYILTATKVKSNFSTEAGLKYFILGSLSSGILLFGISLLYGITGLTNIHDLNLLLMSISNHSLFFSNNILILSLILIVISLLFKFGLVPFHMYVPDVYSGAPTLVTTWFLIIQKLIILVIFINIYNNILVYFYDDLNSFIIFSILASIVLGSITALAQSKVKRLIAYSAIVNGGFLLIGLVTGTLDGLSSSLIFLMIYIILVTVLFTIYLSVENISDNSRLINFKDFILLKKSNLALAICFTLVLFSIAGIPPLAGFFGKLFLFISAIKEQLYLLSIVAILFTVVTAFYYIKLIRIMFFEDILKFSFIKPINKIEAYIISLGSMVNILFFICPKLLLLYINLILFEVYYMI